MLRPWAHAPKAVSVPLESEKAKANTVIESVTCTSNIALHERFCLPQHEVLPDERDGLVVRTHATSRIRSRQSRLLCGWSGIQPVPHATSPVVLRRPAAHRSAWLDLGR